MTFSSGEVEGTLKHISGWTEFSPDPTYNTGNFLCMKVTGAAGTTKSVKLEPRLDPSRPEWVTDADGEFILQISSLDQVLYVKVEKDGVENVKNFSLANLVLESE